MNNSNEKSDEDEDEGISSAVEPADAEEVEKIIKAVRDGLLPSFLTPGEDKKDEIFTVKDTTKKILPEAALIQSEPESKTSSSTSQERAKGIKIQEPPPSTFRKRSRKQKHPCRAPLGDGLSEILESKTWEQPAPSRASSPEMEWPKKAEGKHKKRKESEKYILPKFSLSLGREEIEKDFMELPGNKTGRRQTRRPQDLEKRLNRIFPGSSLEKITAKRYHVPE